MNLFSENELCRIALHIITFKNHKLKYRIRKLGIELFSLYKLDHNDLTHIGFKPEDIANLKYHFKEIAETEIQKCQKNSIEFVFKGDDCYPVLLSEIFDPPDFLYVKGDMSILKDLNIAVVGSRRGSAYGRSVLNCIIPDLCRAGLTIVSGMAYGIDSMSHQIAVREKGKTIGINAGGLLHLYPAGNRSLFDEIIGNGCIVTEFPLDTIPRPFFFPIRNRIIAGISRAVLVVEATIKSGSLITARLALEQNKDVFAIPGRIDSPLSMGTNSLIAQGAKLIGCSQDIFDEYGIKFNPLKKQEKFDLSLKETRILDLMVENDVKDIDYFVEHLDFSVSEIISLLMAMVLKNVIVEVDEGYKKVL